MIASAPAGGAVRPTGRWEWPAWLLLFGAVMAFAVWLRIATPPPTTRSPDETYYLSYARTALLEPFDAPRILTAAYNANRADWDYPIPLRIGYYYLIAAVAALWRVTPEQAGFAISASASILQLAMVALLGLRFFNRWTALLAITLLSVSPQDLAIARRVWCDGVAGCAALIFLWLCAEISIRPRATGWYAALWLWGAFFMLIKEADGFFYGFCLAALAIQSWQRHRSPVRIAWIAAGATGTASVSFILMALLCGGVPAALAVMRHNVEVLPFNLYLVNYQTGPWFSFPLALWTLSPLTATGCALATAALLLRRERLSLSPDQRAIASGLGILILLVLITATLPAYYKNLRYISSITGPWYLMGALGIAWATGRVKRLLGARFKVPLAAIAVTVLLFSCWSDYSRYRELYLRREIPDLDIWHIVTAPFGRDSEPIPTEPIAWPR